MNSKKYGIIYADPPWTYNTKECLHKTSILNGKDNTHYNTLTTEEVKKLNVSTLADNDCLLFLWVVSPMLPEGIEVLKSWGFKYGTIAFIWYKERPNPGYYTMSECEICLVGKRGKIPSPRGSRNVRQFFQKQKSKHSKKPEEIRNKIQEMFPIQNKVELFARESADGWDVLGNGIDGRDIREVLNELDDA